MTYCLDAFLYSINNYLCDKEMHVTKWLGTLLYISFKAFVMDERRMLCIFYIASYKNTRQSPRSGTVLIGKLCLGYLMRSPQFCGLFSMP